MSLSPEASAKLRERRASMHRMRMDGVGYEEIAAKFETTVAAAKRAVCDASKNDGLGPVPRRAKTSALEQDPQAVGNVLASLIVAGATTVPRSNRSSDKYASLQAACAEHGLKPSIVKALIKRMETSLAPVMEEGKRLTVAEIVPEIERKMTMALAYMDHFAMAQASFKDLSVGFSVLAEKHQLLSGKPTMIVDLNARMQLPALLGSMLAEARRRGAVTVEGSAVTVDGPG